MPPPPVLARGSTWDVFCRVVDNFGDVGIAWRLCRNLVRHGLSLRLFIDDASALRWMSKRPEPPVRVLPWAQADAAAAQQPPVVLETFGCGLPPAYRAALAARQPQPLCINVEHLSAEPYVERSHRLPSPQHDGLTTWFFYPGFTANTGGLLREPELPARQTEARVARLWGDLGITPQPGEQLVSLFCYPDSPLQALRHALSSSRCCVLLCPGKAQAQWLELDGTGAPTPGVRSLALPWLDQDDYDTLLAGCALNFVRGEDSAVRAQWAGRPFVWQLYPQEDGAHADKLEAFLQRHLGGASPDTAASVAALWRAWNRLGPWPTRWPVATAWEPLAQAWSHDLRAQPDLCTQLLAFVADRIEGFAPRAQANPH
jgi:uncharacterized repeat protein (TIGR03837 family)